MFKNYNKHQMYGMFRAASFKMENKYCLWICCMFRYNAHFSFTYICILCVHPIIICIVSVYTDDRFPEYGKVEFVFSYGPEKIKGNPSFPTERDKKKKCLYE